MLSKLEKNLTDLQVKINNPETKIREHCEKIRNQIDLNTEILIEKINTYRDQLFNEIETYEKECINNIRPIEKKDKFHRIIRENDSKLKEFYSYINRSKIEEQKVREMMLDAQVQEHKLKQCLKKVDYKLFGDQLIKFEDSKEHPSIKQIEPSIIGRFVYESLHYDHSDQIDMQKCVDSRVDKSIQCKADRCIPLTNDKYLIAHGQHVQIIDEHPHTFVEIKFDFEPLFMAQNGVDSIFVLHHRNMWKNSSKTKNPNPTLSIFDFNLNLKYETTPEISILSLTANSDSIYVQLDKTFNIYVYNWLLERVGVIGQNYFVDRPFYFNDFELKSAKNDKLIFKKKTPNKDGENLLRIVSLETGESMAEFILDGNYEHFYVDEFFRIVVIDKEAGMLKIFDKQNIGSLDMDMIYESTIDMNETSGHFMTGDGRFFFIKDKECIQYFSFCRN